MGLAGSSLAAAIPGAVLFYVLLMAVLKSLEPMPMMLKVAAILMLIISLMMALFPAYLLIWYRRDKVVLSNPKLAGVAAGGLGDEGLVEDLVGQDFVDEDESSAEAAWATADEGDDEGALTGEFRHASDSGIETLEGDDDELVQAEPFDEFGQTMQDIGTIAEGDDEFSPELELEADEFSMPEEQVEDTLQTMELEAAEPAEMEEFGQTLQDFSTVSDEPDEFLPEAVLEEDEFSLPESEDDTLQTMELEVSEDADADMDEFGQTLQDLDAIEASDEFTAAADFDDDFQFEDFDEDDKEQK